MPFSTQPHEGAEDDKYFACMIKDPRNIDIQNFEYHLPDSSIAAFPASPRDSARLLMADGTTRVVSESVFGEVANFLPPGALMLVNETRVVRARLEFFRPSGSRIEVFILNPVEPPDIQQAFLTTGSCLCKVFVGNARRWKEPVLQLVCLLNNEKVTLRVSQVRRDAGAFIVKLWWNPEHLTFAQVLEAAGKTPLPPYIKREATDRDVLDYQTMFARHDGSVAAPTAGLHFTPAVFGKLREAGITMANVVLHVGAGTFKPVNAGKLENHTMHTEQVVVSRATLETIVSSLGKPRVVVGTTTVRTLESLYWFGVRLLKERETVPFFIGQWYPYQFSNEELPSVAESLGSVLEMMNISQLDELHGETQIIIAPPYRYMLTDVLITNFHQPGSTLLLLVAAFAGDVWREAYQYAIDHHFRFLSYGDACLFFPAKPNSFR